MTTFVDDDEAAKLLGLSPEQFRELANFAPGFPKALRSLEAAKPSRPSARMPRRHGSKAPGV